LAILSKGSPGGREREVPDLVRYQFVDGPHAGEPTTERGEIERLARECSAADCRAGLDSTVMETRFNVVRSPVPDIVRTVRRLRDYLPHVDQGSTPARGDVSHDEAAMTVGGRSRAWRAPAGSFPPL
jgi:hypothetical protein